MIVWLYVQGYLVGNGVTDEKFDGNALVPFAHGMALISNELYQVGTEPLFCLNPLYTNSLLL